MKLYYNFSVLDYKDFEVDIPDERIALFLASISVFTADEIMENLSLFTKIFQKKIHDHFERFAKENFKSLIDQDETHAKYVLKSAYMNKRSQSYAKERKIKDDEEFRDSK